MMVLYHIFLFLMWAYMFCQWSYGGLIIFKSIRLYTKLNVKFLAFSIWSTKNHIHEMCQTPVSSCFGWYLSPMMTKDPKPPKMDVLIVGWTKLDSLQPCWAILRANLHKRHESHNTNIHTYTYILLVEWIIKEQQIRYKTGIMAKILLNKVRLLFVDSI